MTKLIRLLLFKIVVFNSIHILSQNIITSTNGWTATINVIPNGVVVSTTDCQWSYHYGINYNLEVVFSGNLSNVDLSFNSYMNCSGGVGNELFTNNLNFTKNSVQNLTTGLNHRQYQSNGNAYEYSPNPSCTNIKLSDANCTSIKLNYWGNGVYNGSTSFPIYGIQPLPVELVSFTGQNINGQNVIMWETGSEKDNDYFTLERSTDGIYWNKVSEISGKGSTSIKQEYFMIDDNFTTNEVNYYRLSQTDYSGKKEVFNNIVSVDNKSKVKELLKVVNMMGQEVNNNISGILIHIYKDGSYEKVIRQ